MKTTVRIVAATLFLSLWLGLDNITNFFNQAATTPVVVALSR